MAFSPKQLRLWMAGGAILVLALVIGFYSYARYQISRELKEVPKKLGADIQRTAEGFKYTQSAGGRALFTISAGRAVQYKEGQKAQLENVRIIVYGEADEYDQIYGKAFAYDPQSGDVVAQGEVLIDLQAQGKPGEDPLQGNAKGRVHFKTSGLTFNQKSGLAETQEKIEFAFPQASGSARGARYDSKRRALTLSSDVRLATSNDSAARGLDPTRIFANRAFIEDQPLRAVLQDARVEQADRQLSANEVTLRLRADNTIERILASGNVRAEAKGKTSSELRAQRADFDFAPDNSLREVVLAGTVRVQATGASPLEGSAGRAVVHFTGRNDIKQVRATESVRFEQAGANQQTTAVQADAVDFHFAGRSRLQRAVTSGASQITLAQADTNQRSVITAAAFEATFAAGNRLRSLTGTPNARLVTATPGQPDRIISGERMVATFDARERARTTLTGIEVERGLQYEEGRRTASAARGRFHPAEDTLYLEGAPRVQDEDAGLTITARNLRFHRRSGEIVGQGEVKTTYRATRGNPSGSLLGGSDPIHGTAENVTANRNTGSARFTGTARLWQGPNMVQAPTIVFDNGRRALTASGNSDTRVQTVFVQADKSGKQVPVQVSAQRLTYVDAERKGHFEGGVRVKVPDTSLSAARVDVLLKPRSQGGTGAGVVDQIIARADEAGSVLIEQENPVRRAVGERLVYEAEAAKFVLTGEPGNPPSIFDAERGNLTADSLTFYTRDDRVHVSSGGSSRTITRTRIKDESKP